MSYDAISYNARWWVTRGGRLLGGYSANELRSYVFPLYTPGGVLVLQEAPPDHPHHQGICVGLEVNGHDLWNAGSFGYARHRQALERPLVQLQHEVTDDGVTFIHNTTWETVEGESLLAEERRVSISAGSECTVVRWRSSWRSASGTARLGQTKEAGIGLRVPPHWETKFGGRIRNAEDALGEAACFDTDSRWLNVEGAAGGSQVAGVVLLAAAGSETCPWFTRDYGLHLYNPSRHHPFVLEPESTVTWEVVALAYDGARSIEQIDALVEAI